METVNKANNNTLGTLLKWGLGTTVTYSLLPQDTRETKSIVAIRPKPPFKPVFQVAAAKEGSEIRIINEPIKGSSVFLVETGENQPLRETRNIPICLANYIKTNEFKWIYVK